MTKYDIITEDICGERSDNIIIIGGHFTEQKAKKILIKKGEIERNMIISDINHGYAKRVNLEEISPCATSEMGWEVLWGSIDRTCDYDRLATIVEVCEDFE